MVTKAPPGNSLSYITIHLIGTTKLRLMGVPTSEVGYTSATTGRGGHEVHKGHMVALWEKLLLLLLLLILLIILLILLQLLVIIIMKCRKVDSCAV
jgi:hypothetical protein